MGMTGGLRAQDRGVNPLFSRDGYVTEEEQGGLNFHEWSDHNTRAETRRFYSQRWMIRRGQLGNADGLPAPA